MKTVATVMMLIFSWLVTIGPADMARAGTGDPVLINEVLVYHSGAVENTEFVELFGIPETSLEGLSLIAVFGTYRPGEIYRRLDFDASHIIGPNGFFLVGNPMGLQAYYGVEPDLAFGANYFWNWSVTIALVETGSLESGQGEQITGSEIVRDAIGFNEGGSGDSFYFNAPVLGPDGPFFPAGACRITDGVDTDARIDWTFASFSLPGGNTPECSGPALTGGIASWGSVKNSYR